MMRLFHPFIRFAALGALAWLLAGCASAPVRYYTLVPSSNDTAPSMPLAPAAFDFELLPVSVPAQDDQPQLVIRQGGQGVAVLQGERWVAPLGDEIRAALSMHLAGYLRRADVSGLPHQDRPVMRVKVDVRRFDSQPGAYALLDAAWSLHLVGKPDVSPVLACTSRISESVGSGYDALVRGHQQALSALAAEIAFAARHLADGRGTCPAQ